jgi:hypothetical protein
MEEDERRQRIQRREAADAKGIGRSGEWIGLREERRRIYPVCTVKFRVA